MAKNQEEKNYISPSGLKKLVDELDYLTKIERPQVTKTVAWAASNGDRSENADYQYGKKRLREIDKRVRFLNSRINKTVIIEPSETKSDKVQFGAAIKVLNLETGVEKEYQIVGVDEVDTSKGNISWRSPIGSAALGKEVGDAFEAITPSGKSEFEILHIQYPNDKLK